MSRSEYFAIVDGNEAAASVAYRLSEVIAIYPITPSSTMGELSDEWAVVRRTNVWGDVPVVQQMQSEAGAAGAVHGAIQAGALSTSFTASQGLLLFIPNLFKIAGELTSFVLHVAARTVATHALSIFGDHSDVMACRTTGFAMLASSSPQEAHDMAAIAHAATLRSRIPFLHFFDGFRTSHELQRINLLSDAELLSLVDAEALAAHRQRALTPDRPILRGSAQNPDTFFQAREAANPFYDRAPAIVEEELERFAVLTGRRYRPFEYYGHPEADSVVVIMGSGVETARVTAEHLTQRGQRVGVLGVRLFRPFDAGRLLSALPPSVRRIAVLDRTKEPGALADPLHLDVVCALDEGRRDVRPVVVGGRYGLSSKEFTPAMVKSIFAELQAKEPQRRFTVGIVDDVTGRSLPSMPELDVFPEGMFQAVFFGLGSDGTVGANKNTIKIVGEETGLHVQGYFVYDSKKSGAVTVSHLRFSPEPIRAPYLVTSADFVACHQFELVDSLDIAGLARPGGVLLLNSSYRPDETWDKLPRELQEAIIEKRLALWVVDAAEVAREAGLGGRINTVMQVAFFAVSGVLPRDEAIVKIKEAIAKTYARKGADVVRKNVAAVDGTLGRLHRAFVPGVASTARCRPPIVSPQAPDFVQRVTALMLSGMGDRLPVSAFSPDGTWPLGTAKWEKRNLALEIPAWDSSLCIQCNKCALVCPHAAIRAKVTEPSKIAAGAPEGFLSVPYKGQDFAGKSYIIQVAPEDCTGCQACVVICPAKDKSNPRHKALDMVPQRERRDAERIRYEFFLSLPEVDRATVPSDIKGSQFLQPLFEYSGACSGCGETPYIKLMTQLFGDRLYIANATGCSSIYGGNLPTTPYVTNADGRGPSWSNSLFEDNAEFGFGMRLAVDAHRRSAEDLVRRLAGQIGQNLADALLSADDRSEGGIAERRRQVRELRSVLEKLQNPEARRLERVADFLVRKSVWLVGGDGWAYDIGFGGLDHVLAQNRDVNILVLDTGVYSNTGGQQSKATPLGASAKFAIAGKEVAKKDLGLIAMSYGHVYVAQVAYGAKDVQTVRAFREAEAHPGPSLIIAYSHCIAHGYDLARGPEQQKLAAEAGVWPLYTIDPARIAKGEPAMTIDMGATPKRSVRDWALNEARFRVVEQIDKDRFKRLGDEAQRSATRRTEVYQQLAQIRVSAAGPPAGNEVKPATPGTGAATTKGER